MPGIDLEISGARDAKLAEHIAREVIALVCQHLDKQVEHSMLVLRYAPHEDWFIAGKSLAEIGQNSFRLEVTVTDETNTKQQKAAFHRAAFATLAKLIGNVHPHSNIHVIDCRAAAYGYGGLTQEYRHQHPDAPADSGRSNDDRNRPI